MQPVNIGTDPELFLFNPHGVPVSAIGKIPGSKHAPHQVPDLPTGFCVQVDNCSVEYNLPPTNDADVFVTQNTLMLDWLKQHFKKENLALKTVPSVRFSKKELDHPDAWVFGCEPDFNAWTVKTNPRPETKDKFLRSAGGHIHVECPDFSNKEKVIVVRYLDYFVGVVLHTYEPPNKRAQLYGAPGAMRFKKYGLEWRTPSNFWLSTPQATKNIHRAVTAAVQAFKDEYLIDKVMQCTNEDINHMFDKKNVNSNITGFFAHYLSMYPQVFYEKPKAVESLDMDAEYIKLMKKRYASMATQYEAVTAAPNQLYTSEWTTTGPA